MVAENVQFSLLDYRNELFHNFFTYTIVGCLIYYFFPNYMYD